jgi:antitoxin (DNA-binding transcriptional repressor) of toxin-antitoxin stability system
MKPVCIPFTQAKSRLSEYARLAEAGQSTLVVKHHKPAFMIAPVLNAPVVRTKRPGLARGRIRIAPDFDTTPREILDSFEGQG